MKMLLCLGLFAALSLYAQTNSGTILGTVRDAQDAVVTTASVTVTNVDTGVAKTVQVSPAGEYTVPFLVPGTYSVSGVAAGFKRSTEEGIVVRVSDHLVIDLHLQVGAVSETVNVQASAPLLESATITLGQVVDTKQILDLPLNGRDSM